MYNYSIAVDKEGWVAESE